MNIEIEIARSIAKDYIKPNSQIDNGNLYWALTSCLEYIRQLEKKKEALTDDERSELVMRHLGPNALLGGKMSVLDAFVIGMLAAEEAHGIIENT